MRKLACLLAAVIVTVHTETPAFALTVPFENISLTPNAQLQASYNFGQSPEIFCFDNTLQTQGNVTWPYKGKLFNAPWPLLLTTNSAFTGQLADATGLITLTNNTTTTLQVSCLFGF